MKIKAIIFFLLILVPSHICLSSDNIFQNNDGQSWNAFSISIKTAYTIGFLTGFNHAVYFTEDLSPSISIVLENIIPKNRTLAQMIDGVNTFYSDFKNKHIKLNMAFAYVFYALQEGTTESELEEMLIEMRKDIH